MNIALKQSAGAKGLEFVEQTDAYCFAHEPGVLVVIWKVIPTLSAFNQFLASFERRVTGPSDAVGMLVVILDQKQASALDDSVRKRQSEALKRLDSRFVALASVVPSDGVIPKLLRIAMNATVMLAGGLHFPVKMFGEARSAADWLEAQLRSHGKLAAGWAPLRDQVARLIAQLEAGRPNA